MRGRTQQSTSNLQHCETSFIQSDGTVYPWTFRNPGSQFGVTKAFQDVLTPNYSHLRKQGAIILNPMSLLKEDCKASDTELLEFNYGPSWGNALISGDVMGFIITQIMTGGGTRFDFNVQSGLDMALIKAYAKMNESPLLSGEILSDLSRTVSMLKRPFGKARELIGKIANARKRYLKRTSHNAQQASASAWLEYRYGWVPIMMDCVEITRQADKIIRQQSNYGLRVARATVVNSGKYSEPYSVQLLGAYNCTGSKECEGKVTANAGVLYRFKPISIPGQITQALGIQVRDIPATVWEVIPFSFVIDWFVNVGPWLQALAPRPDIDVLGNWTTSVVNTRANFPAAAVSRTVNGVTLTHYSNTLDYKWSRVERKVNEPIAWLPSLRKELLTKLQTADAIALGAGQITQLLRTIRH